MARGHIRQRGKAWEVRVEMGRREDGRRKIATVTVHGREAADKKLTELLRAKDTGTTIDPNTVTVGQWMDEWLDLIEVGNKTLERYRGLVKCQIQPFLGNVRLQALEPLAVEQWHKDLKKRGGRGGTTPLADITVRNAHRVLAIALRRAKKLKLVATNVASDAGGPSVKKKRLQILKADEVRLVLEKLAGHDLFPAVHTLLATGVRRGELCGLRWSDINLDTGIIRVMRAVEQSADYGLQLKEPKTESGVRDIKVHAEAVEVLRRHKVAQMERRMVLGLGRIDDETLAFPDHDGSLLNPDVLSKRWAAAVEVLGLPKVRLHSLRHSHASALINAKVDVAMISNRLGHANPSITLSVYSQLFSKDDAEAAAAIGKVMG